MSDDLVKMFRRLSKYDHVQLSSTDLERIANRIEELEAERDEALNQLDSARYSVEVLEKRVAFVEKERKGVMAVGIKRHEYKLPLANWLRDEINEVLARYDIPSDVYERDVLIDALCVITIDKIESTLAELKGQDDE